MRAISVAEVPLEVPLVPSRVLVMSTLFRQLYFT